MKPNMKRSTAPALHASANIGLRPAVDGSIIVAIYYGIRIPKERQEGIEAAEAGGARGRGSRRLDGQSSHPTDLGGLSIF